MTFRQTIAAYEIWVPFNEAKLSGNLSINKQFAYFCITSGTPTDDIRIRITTGEHREVTIRNGETLYIMTSVPIQAEWVNKHLSVVESPVTPIGSIIDLENIDPTKPHCFVGVRFFGDAAGLIPVVPSTGTVLITVKTVNNMDLYEGVPDGLLQATSPTTISWSANTLAVKAVAVTVDIASHYRITVTSNRS